MKQFNCMINDPEGFHLRSASSVVKEAKKYACDINIATGEKSANAKDAFGILELKIKTGDTISFIFEGQDEEEAAANMQSRFENNL